MSKICELINEAWNFEVEDIHKYLLLLIDGVLTIRALILLMYQIISVTLLLH